MSDSGKPGVPEVRAETVRWLDPKSLSFDWRGADQPVRLTIADEVSYLRVTALRAFPQAAPDEFVQLFSIGSDGERQESIGMIENLAALRAEAGEVVRRCLHESYLVPRIVRILDIGHTREVYLWRVETDRGEHSFEMERIHENLKLLSERRVVCRDTQENRYEIPDLGALDAHSRALLDRYL